MSSPPWFDPSAGERLGVVELATASSSDLYSQRLYFNGATDPIAHDVLAKISFHFNNGNDSVLDFTDQENPSVLVAGVYGFTIQVQATSIGAADTAFSMILEMNNAELSAESNWPMYNTDVHMGNYASACGVLFIEQGATIDCLVLHSDVTQEIAFSGCANLQRIA